MKYKKTKKRVRKKFSLYEKYAYYMGVGAGLSGGDSRCMTDVRLGLGQDVKLCDSAKEGYWYGRKKFGHTPFDRHTDIEGVCTFIFGKKRKNNKKNKRN